MIINFIGQDVADALYVWTARCHTEETGRHCTPNHVDDVLINFDSIDGFHAEGVVDFDRYPYNEQGIVDAIAFYLDTQHHFLPELLEISLEYDEDDDEVTAEIIVNYRD